MKKCPNCNKAVPFGARRCVYCRTPLDDENSTPNDQVVSERGFNATSRNFDNGSDFGLEDNPRKFNKTMIGLGPVSIHDAPKENTDSFAQRTIAGMRGISFDDALDTNKPGIYRMSGKSSISKETLNQAAPQFKKTLFQTSPIDSEVSPTPAADKPRAAAPAKQTAPEPAQEQKEDILAGLPGAAPMPSSLVDEEFVDLTSQVFGDDFASITQEAADDDDGLDFDFPTAPAPVKAEPPKSESVKADDKSKNIIAAPEKALSDSVQSAPASSTSDSTASTDPAPASSSPAKKKKSKKKKDGPLDYVAIACAACGVLASVVVIVSLKGSGPVPIILLALAAALDGIFFAIRKKLSSMGRAILFFIAALVILGGLVMTKNALIIIPMICQVIGALCCFLKKA